ncbi:hypothetical protein [Pinibacter aurantiacus]|uniref:Uncharacterized protein n=1 Tax=Pinibacter aurantiacus TaxID=2851599 RepID=A0A9E2SAV8_9BACT|nr:hypothetical protein [Pinibacter aurantiacus]MBV4356500.1 hypothetical protein [Pinibacter aurantiacus]
MNNPNDEKHMLVLRASEDISNAEIVNICSQIAQYGIKADIEEIDGLEKLTTVFKSGKQYDYIYLATHGCESSWGNISGSVSITWIEFAALTCITDVLKPGAIFLHSCCRGGLNQVAWQMFACCEKIEFVCGPRHNLLAVDLTIAFNLFLYNLEIKRIDPVRAAEKVLDATDIRLTCFDKVETVSDIAYVNHSKQITNSIDQALTKFGFVNLQVQAEVIDNVKN